MPMRYTRTQQLQVNVWPNIWVQFEINFDKLIFMKKFLSLQKLDILHVKHIFKKKTLKFSKVYNHTKGLLEINLSLEHLVIFHKSYSIR